MEQRIQNKEFKSIDEIAKDFVTLEERLNETFPSYTGKSELFNEFKTRVYAFAGNYFAKKAESEKKFIEERVPLASSILGKKRNRGIFYSFD